MPKIHFAMKLIPSRPTFAQDMTNEERTIMQQHVVYWKDYMEQGIMLVFGPVLDPAGVYGLGILEVDDEEQAKTLMANDPASSINKYEYHQMMALTKSKV